MVKRILLVEDNDYHRLMVKDFLVSKDYQVLSLPNGEDLLSCVAKFKPNVILLDLRLPQIDAYSLLKQLKQSQWRFIPVIIISAYSFEKYKQKALDLGAYSYLTKPIRLEAISDAILALKRMQVSELPKRYNIARSAVYTRLKDLGIEPEKEGRRAYVSAQQLQFLDALHEHLQQGGSTTEFLKQKERDSSSLEPKIEDTLNLNSKLPETAVEELVKRLIPNTGNRLAYLRELEEACEKGWLLSTQELADLLMFSPDAILGYGEKFTDAGFLFTRAGMRIHGEVAWRVSKMDLEKDDEQNKS